MPTLVIPVIEGKVLKPLFAYYSETRPESLFLFNNYVLVLPLKILKHALENKHIVGLIVKAFKIKPY